MSTKYLGNTFDIHTGGIDNLFPHHENEIAQTEGATGEEFVRYWMHCAHLQVNGTKMSKSLGNFYTLRDLIEQGWQGREIRYVLIGGQYRQPLNFTFAALEAARAALIRVDSFVDRLNELAANVVPGLLPLWAEEGSAAFDAAIFDDLNTPEALAALYGIIAKGNNAMQEGKLAAPEAAAVLDLLRRLDKVLGVIFFGRQTGVDIPAEVQQMADDRALARQNKNWGESDRLRDAIAAAGWEIRDSKEGQKLTPRS
jgi:cysteinyl-tRNA synthetase